MYIIFAVINVSWAQAGAAPHKIVILFYDDKFTVVKNALITAAVMKCYTQNYFLMMIYATPPSRTHNKEESNKKSLTPRYTNIKAHNSNLTFLSLG